MSQAKGVGKEAEGLAIIFEIMQIKVFTLPTIHSEQMEEEINKFLRGHRVMTIDRQFCCEHGGYWTMFITYQDGGDTGNSSVSRSGKIDYREVLSPEHFARFAQMRELRKELAAHDGVPPYAVFTDAELAEMAQMHELTVAAISSIKGVGKRADKYGTAFVQAQSSPRE